MLLIARATSLMINNLQQQIVYEQYLNYLYIVAKRPWWVNDESAVVCWVREYQQQITRHCQVVGLKVRVFLCFVCCTSEKDALSVCLCINGLLFQVETSATLCNVGIFDFRVAFGWWCFFLSFLSYLSVC